MKMYYEVRESIDCGELVNINSQNKKYIDV